MTGIELLAQATHDDLERDARLLTEIAGDEYEPDYAAALRRAAALARAVADVERNGRDVLFGSRANYSRHVEIDGDGLDCAGQGQTLLAALASLITETPK